MFTLQRNESTDTQTQQTATINTAPDLTQGLHYRTARHVGDVLEAWHLVYKKYLHKKLIDPNPCRLHVVPQVIGPHTVVTMGWSGPVLANTLSAFIDSPGGLPLDSVYRRELDNLRDRGRRLMEVGLFADRREQLNRSADGLFDLMRFAFHYARWAKVDDIIIGVHPRHAPFYARCFAGELIGQLKQYPTVRNNPVMLMRLNIEEKLKLERLPRGLAYFMRHPVHAEMFENRFLFEPNSIARSPIGDFLPKSEPVRLSPPVNPQRLVGASKRSISTGHWPHSPLTRQPRKQG